MKCGCGAKHIHLRTFYDWLTSTQQSTLRRHRLLMGWWWWWWLGSLQSVSWEDIRTHVRTQDMTFASMVFEEAAGAFVWWSLVVRCWWVVSACGWWSWRFFDLPKISTGLSYIPTKIVKISVCDALEIFSVIWKCTKIRIAHVTCDLILLVI
jgi:hypothetical protein